MIVYDTIEQLRLQINKWRNNKETIALVPTMGNLHAGHLSLVEIAQQKEMVEESEAKLSSTISSIDDLVFVLDKAGVFQEFYNRGKHKTLYSEAESYIGKHFKNVGFPELVVKQLTDTFSELIHKDSFSEFDYSFEKEDDTFWFNAKISPRRNVKGVLSGITIVARDITERKQWEEQLKELNTTKDTFFSILAHDLKNPFSSLHSMSEMMINSYQNLEEEEKIMALKNVHLRRYSKPSSLRRTVCTPHSSGFSRLASEHFSLPFLNDELEL